MALDYKGLQDEFVKEFHLEQVPKEKQDELLEKMGEALLKRIFLETMEKIGEQGVTEYEALLDAQAKQEDIDAFFESKIPGYNNFVSDIVKDFKEEMKKVA
jgi:hypothetical protein